MKIIYLLALSFSATVSLTVVAPAIVQAEETRRPQATAPKTDPLAAIIQQEATLLKRPQTSETAIEMSHLYRQVVANSLEFYRARSPSPVVPSTETTVYFGDLYQRYPKSGILSILFAESLAEQPDDFGQVAPIYQDAIKAAPNHPLLARYYADYLQRQGTKRGLVVLEQAIRNQPQNPNTYLDLAHFQQANPGLTLAVFDRAIAAFPKNTAVYTQFAKIAVDRQYDRESLTEVIDRLVIAQKKFPKNPDLSASLATLYKQVRKNSQ
jgi:predicted Zn-dependent protease